MAVDQGGGGDIIEDDIIQDIFIMCRCMRDKKLDHRFPYLRCIKVEQIFKGTHNSWRYSQVYGDITSVNAYF